MLKAIIVDDEAKARRILENFITEYCPQIQICALVEDVPQAVKVIKKYEPDVVFLDIEMPGYNGFQLFEFFEEVNFEIIFITAYSEFALKAFQVSAIDYLLKPLQIDQLINAVKKLETKANKATLKNRIEVLQNNIQEQVIKKIVVPFSNGSLFLETSEITHLKAEGSYVNIFIRDGSKILVSKNIKDYEEILTANEGFFRTHRSFLLNKNYIVKLNSDSTEAILTTGNSILIARERKQDFLQFIRNR
jgi:two-component system LytT family response regulator